MIDHDLVNAPEPLASRNHLRGSRRSTTRGFTLIELLVVIAIVAVLVALILPAVQQAREAARRTQCKNNLKQIGLGLFEYHNTNRNLPPGWGGVKHGRPATDGYNGWGWASMILPQIEEQSLFRSIDFTSAMVDPVNAPARLRRLSVFRCPSDTAPDTWTLGGEMTGSVAAKWKDSDASRFFCPLCLPPDYVFDVTLPIANYIGSFGTMELDACEEMPTGQTYRSDGVFFHNSSVRLRDVFDGVSNTIFIGERRTDTVLGWYSTWTGVVPRGDESHARILGVADHTPNHPSAHFEDYSSWHSSGVHILFGDGRVRFLSNSVDETVFHALATRSGNEQAVGY